LSRRGFLVLGFTAETAAAWTAWGTGLAIAVLAAAAIVQFAEWEEWANLVLGLWLVVAPWIVRFTNVIVAQWTHVVLAWLQR
jgi:SPW repeat